MDRSNLKQSFLYESGQALVLVLLSLSVVLTIVLFVLSRSITDISTSSKQEESVRAFSAAEAGIENALITKMGYQNISIGNASYSVEVSKSSEGSTTFNYPIGLMSGDSINVWFVSHDNDGDLVCDSSHPCFNGSSVTVCWGAAGDSSGSDTTPAVEVSIYSDASAPTGVSSHNFSGVEIARGVYDPNRTRSNNFSAPDAGTCSIGGVNYAFQKRIAFTDLGISNYSTTGSLLFAKVRMLYNSTGKKIGVSVAGSGDTLPAQGLDIVSTGSSGTADSQGDNSNRKINVFEGWSEFQFGGFSVYTPGGITKGS